MENLKKFIQEFREIQPKFSRFYSRMLACAGLTPPQYSLMLELLHAVPHPLSMTALSRKLYISKPAVTSLADRLEKRRFLKRIAHPEDRRIALLQIQPAGQKLVSQLRDRILKLIRQTAKLFNDQEISTVRRFYSVLSKELDESLTGSKKLKTKRIKSDSPYFRRHS